MLLGAPRTIWRRVTSNDTRLPDVLRRYGRAGLGLRSHLRPDGVPDSYRATAHHDALGFWSRPTQSLPLETDTKEIDVDIRTKRPTMKGAAETFTGDVWIDEIARGEEPSRVRVNVVRFSPGARTAWHSHAMGQTLYVTEGAGLVQPRGGEILEIRPGEIISTPSEEWHWHGATPDSYMAHLSITEGVGDNPKPEADWGEHVTDAEYRGRW